MNFLVTVIGGSGFVGTNFCQLLEDKQVPFEILDLKVSRRFPEKTKIADVRDIASLRSTLSGGVVVNLAAVHRDDVTDKGEYYRTNVLGAENIAKVCHEKDIRKIIFTSSVAVYGFAEPGTDESGAINPFNEYGRTKFEAEEVLRRWQRESNGSLLIIRPTVIFGPGNRGNVYNLIKQIASGRFVMIGDGTNKKSMAYIANVVAFLDVCMAEPTPYAVYNYVDEPSFTIAQLVTEVRRALGNNKKTEIRLPYIIGLLLGYFADLGAKITGIKLPVSSIRVRKFCSQSEFKSSHQRLKFEPKYTLQEAISQTVIEEFVTKSENNEVFYTE